MIDVEISAKILFDGRLKTVTEPGAFEIPPNAESKNPSIASMMFSNPSKDRNNQFKRIG